MKSLLRFGLGLLATAAICGDSASAKTVAIALEDAHKADLSNALQLLNGGKPDQAEPIFVAVIAAYEAQAKPGHIYRCADDATDAIKVSLFAAAAPEKDVTVLGPGWCLALFGEGFALIDLNRASEAEAFLGRAVEMAPTKPHYVNEYAEWFKTHRQWQKAYDLFALAWDLVDHEQKGPDRKIAARALRGMGFTQIELGDLNRAEKLLKRSLEFEPEKQSAVAGELQYIADQRKKTASPSPPSASSSSRRETGRPSPA